MILIEILLIINFSLFLLAGLLIIIDVLKARKRGKEGSEEKGLPKLSGYSYGIGLLALVTMVFIGLLISF
ncbi:MAG: hypothetical protein GF353_20760 [Candidatus Lokiarchaeota archaeon]|nr:hypothetical protein [Candidatus Lokiarchaeota archaeon]